MSIPARLASKQYGHAKLQLRVGATVSSSMRSLRSASRRFMRNTSRSRSSSPESTTALAAINCSVTPGSSHRNSSPAHNSANFSPNGSGSARNELDNAL